MSAIRILLIDPTTPWITNSSVLKNQDQVTVPIGLMYLSSYLKQRLGSRVEVRIVSTIVDLPEPGDLELLLTEFRPDIVGIRCVIFYAEQIDDLVITIKRHAPDALLVAGGPNVTRDNVILTADRQIDLLVEGEGERPFSEIVSAYLERDRASLEAVLPSMPGVSYWRDGVRAYNAPGPRLEALDDLPFPDYEAIDLDKYQAFLNYGYTRRKMGILFTSRGCPFHCTYCHVVFGKQFRPRSAENIHAEIVWLHEKYGIEDFAIIDDNFTVKRDRVQRFIELMVNRGPKVRFYFPNGIRADSLDFDLLEGMQKAGTIYATFSLETASPRLQKLVKKHTNVEKLRRIVEHACDLGIITNLCVMVGFPTETFAEAKDTLRYFAQFDRLVLPYYFAVKYYPGTELFHTASDYGISIDGQSYTAPYHGYEFQQTPLIARDQFELLNQWYLRNIYLNPRRLANAVAILRRHFSEQEICDMYSLFFRRRIDSVDRDVLELELAP